MNHIVVLALLKHFYLWEKKTEWIRHKLQKLMKSSPVYIIKSMHTTKENKILNKTSVLSYFFRKEGQMRTMVVRYGVCALQKQAKQNN